MSDFFSVVHRDVEPQDRRLVHVAPVDVSYVFSAPACDDVIPCVRVFDQGDR